MPMNVPHPIKRLASNNAGRDFIVGDLHGCRHLLENALEQVNFDPKVDRVLSAGDLVNRGPASFETLALITEPWFHFVLGNHEAMLLIYLRKRLSESHGRGDFIYAGGAWLEFLTLPQLKRFEEELLPVLLDAPLVLNVDDAACPFHVLHGQAWSKRQGQLRDIDLVNAQVVSAGESGIIWVRYIADSIRDHIPESDDHDDIAVLEPAMEPELSLTYAGHTIVSRPILHRSHLFIDCGAYKTASGAGYLKLLEHKKVVERLRNEGVRL